MRPLVLVHVLVLVLVLVLGCDGAPSAEMPPPPPPGTDAGSAPTCPTDPLPPLPAPLFVEVTAGAGLLPSRGFGRVLVVDVDGDGRDDVVGMPAHDGALVAPDPYAKLVLRSRGDGTFEDATAASGLAGVDAGLLVFADVDADGDQDLFAGTIAGRGLAARGIWRNDGRGHFAQLPSAVPPVETLACGERTCTPAEIGATFADLDGDGLLDLYVGAWFWSDGMTDTRYTPPLGDRLYLGNGNGTFRDASDRLPPHAHPRSGATGRFGRAAMGVSAGDYDNDADLDLFVANYGAGRPGLRLPEGLTCQPPRYWDQDLLWRNDGGALVDVGEAAGVNATMRGPLGILSEEPLVIGDECPEEARGSYPSPIGGNSFTSSFGDFDNDGDLDLVVGSIAHPDYLQSDPTLLFVNQGPPGYRFVDESAERGLLYREDEKHALFADLDADGRLDLVTTGLRNPDDNELRVYLQQDGRFAVSDVGIDDRRQETVVFLDFDGDGDLDLYLAEDEGPARLFESRAADTRHTLVVRLEGGLPADATGARITLASSAGPQLREVTSGNGHYNPQLPRRSYFGLGGDGCARDVTVRWPDGHLQRVGDVAADQELVITRD